MIEYLTLNNICKDIRENLWKIPRDILGVVGVPRSGMLPATIISEFLNVGLADINELIIDKNPIETFQINHGGRFVNPTYGNKILVVDDTCFAGSQNLDVRRKIGNNFAGSGYEFIFLVVYLEGSGHISMPDIYLKDIRNLALRSDLGIVLYEWNIFNHNPRSMNKMLFDYDGVFCLDPPDERNKESYEKYIANPTPLFIPTNNSEVKINIVTYRLEKYRAQTEGFLRKNGVRNINLTMYNADTYEERSKISPEVYKSNIYGKSNALLFVESDDKQAQRINSLTKKPVYCVSTNKMYN